MGNIITVQIPDTEENKEVVAKLIGIPGVRIETNGLSIGKKFVNLQEGSAIAGVSYFTFRKWVIEQKKIPYERPSGAKQGGVRLLVDNIEAFLEGRGGKSKVRGHRGNGKVNILS
jgi:hypothetical protein